MVEKGTLTNNAPYWLKEPHQPPVIPHWPHESLHWLWKGPIDPPVSPHWSHKVLHSLLTASTDSIVAFINFTTRGHYNFSKCYHGILARPRSTNITLGKRQWGMRCSEVLHPHHPPFLTIAYSWNVPVIFLNAGNDVHGHAEKVGMWYLQSQNALFQKESLKLTPTSNWIVKEAAAWWGHLTLHSPPGAEN